MRVDERSLGEQVSSTASRAAESQRIQVDTSGRSSSSGAAAGDRVEMSGLTGRISQALEAQAHQSAQRVGQLRKDFQAGRYQPGAEQIGRAMASEWLGAATS